MAKTPAPTWRDRIDALAIILLLFATALTAATIVSFTAVTATGPAANFVLNAGRWLAQGLFESLGTANFLFVAGWWATCIS